MHFGVKHAERYIFDCSLIFLACELATFVDGSGMAGSFKRFVHCNTVDMPFSPEGRTPISVHILILLGFIIPVIRGGSRLDAKLLLMVPPPKLGA